MSYKVTISKRAEENLDKLVNYLESNWSTRVRDKFLTILENKISQIAETPLIYQASGKRQNVRRCVITRQTALYYQIKENEIEIITIQDNRRDPGRIQL